MLNRLKSIAKRLLAITKVRRAYEKTLLAVLEILAANRLGSVAYSILAVPTFNREQFAVLRGRRDYYRNLNLPRSSRTELRRNIHRLEKGLLMQPRRPTFALDYLIETIEFYEKAVAQQSAGRVIDQAEMEWAYSVLTAYFRAVDRSDPTVSRALDRFEATKPDYTPSGTRFAPYRRVDSKMSSASYDDLLALSIQRRSVRWFEHKPVPRELVDKALLVGRQAPTACNRLPYEFRIFDDPELVRKVSSIPFGGAGYSQQIPTIVVVVGRLHHYFSPRDRHVIYVDSSLAAMSFMLALETLGLGSSVINWPDFEPLEAKMQKAIGLSYDERVIMLIAVGYPDPEGMVAYSQKKSLDVIRRYN